jgi:hypothetical protein
MYCEACDRTEWSDLGIDTETCMRCGGPSAPVMRTTAWMLTRTKRTGQMDKCERLMSVLRSACVTEQNVSSSHVIYAQEVVAELVAANARIAALEAQNAGLLDQVLELENLRDALEAQLAEGVKADVERSKVRDSLITWLGGVHSLKSSLSGRSRTSLYPHQSLEGELLRRSEEMLEETIDMARHAIDALSALEATPSAPKVMEGHPMQPVVMSERGIHRFKSNKCVEALLDHGQKTGFGLNELAYQAHTAEDQMQLAQLIGYSVSGYGDLGYVTDASYDLAAKLSQALTAAQEAGK